MINEHDIKDFPNSPYANNTAMIKKKLYELKNGTYFQFMNNEYLFVKPDGMYAILQDSEGNQGNLNMACEVLIPLKG